MKNTKDINAANRSLHRRVRRNGKQWVCEYDPGFYKHCLLLIDAMKPGDKWTSSGRATVSPNDKDHPLRAGDAQPKH